MNCACGQSLEPVALSVEVPPSLISVAVPTATGVLSMVKLTVWLLVSEESSVAVMVT